MSLVLDYASALVRSKPVSARFCAGVAASSPLSLEMPGSYVQPHSEICLRVMRLHFQVAAYLLPRSAEACFSLAIWCLSCSYGLQIYTGSRDGCIRTWACPNPEVRATMPARTTFNPLGAT